MKRKKVREIAKAQGLYNFPTSKNMALKYESGFIDGAEWRINSVWHDIKEMPENNRMILIIMQHDIPTVIGPDNTFFKEEIKDRHIQRWAYVEDLKPNTED